MRELLGDVREIVLDAADRRDLADLDAPDSLRGENLVGGVSVDHARDQDVRESRQCFPELRRIARLGAVIELVDESPLDLLHDTDEIDP